MNQCRFTWPGLMVSLVVMLVMGGCGGGSSSSSTPAADKVAITGNVSFTSLTNLVAKQGALPSTAVTVELRNLNGAVVATTTATAAGTGVYHYSFAGLDTADYVIKAKSGNYVLKALVDKASLSTATTRDIDTIGTTALILAEQRLGVPVGTIGERANAISTDGIAGVQPRTIEANIATAVATLKTAPATATQDMVNLVNLANVVTATVSNGVDTTEFMSGTGTTTSITTTQFTYTSGTAPVATTAPVTQAAAQAVVNTAAPTTVYIQYRTTEANPYVTGWVAVDTSLYTSATLKDAAGNIIPPFPATSAGISKVDYQLYDCFTGASCVTGTLFKDDGFYINLPVTFVAGNYNFELRTATTTVVRPVNYAGVISLPVVGSSSMNASKTGTDFNFTWQNPVTDSSWSSVNSVRVELQDRLIPNKKVMIIMKTTAQAVTLPRSVVTLAGINPDATTLEWRIQTRQNQNGINVARGLSNWKAITTAVTPPPPTSSNIQAAFTSGLYELWSDSNGTRNYYSTARIGLAANGSNLTETNTFYLDPITRSWTSTRPAGFPTDNADYGLTTNGWVLMSDGPTDDTVTFNADGSANIMTPVTGGNARITLAQVNVAGQAISTYGLDGAPLITNPAPFPAGSLRYDLTWNQLSDDYNLWDQMGGMGTDLSLIPGRFAAGSGMQADLNTNNNNTSSFYAQFVGGASNVVNIYQRGAAPVLVGTATYAITTVRGMQILEISIPSALRTQYSFADNPIFALAPTGFIMYGGHSFPGATDNDGGGLYNEIAMNHIRSNINTALAKPVVAGQAEKNRSTF